VTIHSDHPFMTPESDRSPIRRFRGRLASPVSLWTAQHDGQPAGLTVSSMLVADGEPGYIVGVLDPLSDLWDALIASGAAAVTLLDWSDYQLADQFGYVAPAPGGPFKSARWQETKWGPVLQHATAWAGARLIGVPTELGWGRQVTLAVEHIEVAADPDRPLIHRRGRYRTLAEQAGRTAEPTTTEGGGGATI
jgi:flavin reductase (DIM6/NTAB) family NADH-FMN oxidoreductase RutF